MTTNLSTTDPLAELLSVNAENVQEQKLSLLYKGPPGSGKTHNWLTFPGKTVALYTDKNMATVTEAIGRGVEARLVIPKSWSEWADVFVPAVRNRMVDAENIVVDTVDMLTKLMWREIQGTRDKLRIQDFGTGLDRMTRTINDVCSAATHQPGERSYNIVMCSHVSDVTDDSGALVKTTCSVMGQFKDVVESLFDYVLLTAAEVKTDIVEGKAQKTKSFFCHTIPPTRYHTVKAPAYFPHEIEGTWQGLQSALALKPGPAVATETTETT